MNNHKRLKNELQRATEKVKKDNLGADLTRSCNMKEQNDMI